MSAKFHCDKNKHNIGLTKEKKSDMSQPYLPCHYQRLCVFLKYFSISRSKLILIKVMLLFRDTKLTQ